MNQPVDCVNEGRYGNEQAERLRQQLADVELQQRAWAANANAARQQARHHAHPFLSHPFLSCD